jgi:hypothetical protein
VNNPTVFNDALQRDDIRFFPVRSVLSRYISVVTFCIIPDITLVNLSLTGLAKPRHLDHLFLLASFTSRSARSFFSALEMFADQRVVRTRDFAFLLAYGKLEVGDLLVQELSRLLRFVVLVIALVFNAFELLVNVTVSLAFFTIFITVIAAPTPGVSASPGSE